MTSRDGGLHRFLVKWHGRPDSDATWIQEDDLLHLDSSLLDCYLSFHFQSQVLFNPEGMMEHGVGPYLGLNEIGSLSPMMNFITIGYLFNCIFGFIR